MQKIIQTLVIAALAINVYSTNSFAANTQPAEEAYAKKAISRFPIPQVQDLPEDARKIIKGAEKRLGFVPNIVAALSHRPAELKAFSAYNQAFNAKESGITKAEKEMFLIATSAANGCAYCVVSHGAALRLATSNPFISDQIAANYREADITKREKAIIDFAMKVSFDSKSINEEDFETLRKQGLSDEDIWDVAGITALYNLSNRMMNVLKVRPDEEFYLLGR